jgi:4-aminobutyrate aminotransferase/(S)-3-amino-2-methylpropionate transaminase
MVGVRLTDGAEALAVSRALLQRGYIVLTGGLGGETLTLSPPLTIAPELLSAFVQELGAAVAKHRRP